MDITARELKKIAGKYGYGLGDSRSTFQVFPKLRQLRWSEPECKLSLVAEIKRIFYRDGVKLLRASRLKYEREPGLPRYSRLRSCSNLIYTIEKELMIDGVRLSNGNSRVDDDTYRTYVQIDSQRTPFGTFFESESTKKWR